MKIQKYNSIKRYLEQGLLIWFPGSTADLNFVLLIFLFVAGAILSPGKTVAEPSEVYRIGFSSAMFTDVNDNDAKAAIRIWGEQITREKNVPADLVPFIIKDLGALRESLKEKKVDAVGITTIEYDQLRSDVVFSTLFVTSISGSIYERYVLLANRESPVKTLGDLGGRSFAVHSNPRACLAPMWLDTLLVHQGHPPISGFAGRIIREDKLAKVVLPVFFGRVAACVVSRSGFETMVELNPQLARQLVVLAESPAVVPAIFAFRADYEPEYKDKLVKGLQELQTSPAGQQVLTIFQSDNIEIQPLSSLDTALELIATHKQLVLREQNP